MIGRRRRFFRHNRSGQNASKTVSIIDVSQLARCFSPAASAVHRGDFHCVARIFQSALFRFGFGITDAPRAGYAAHGNRWKYANHFFTMMMGLAICGIPIWRAFYQKRDLYKTFAERICPSRGIKSCGLSVYYCKLRLSRYAKCG